MLIYHQTNHKIQCTQVIIGANNSQISHSEHVWEKHQKNVKELRNNGKVFVTGATHNGAVYEGMFEDRKKYQHYLEN